MICFILIVCLCIILIGYGVDQIKIQHEIEMEDFIDKLSNCTTLSEVLREYNRLEKTNEIQD